MLIVCLKDRIILHYKAVYSQTPKTDLYKRDNQASISSLLQLVIYYMYCIIYYKFTIISENFIFANIREFDPSQIQHSCEIFAYVEFK